MGVEPPFRFRETIIEGIETQLTMESRGLKEVCR